MGMTRSIGGQAGGADLSALPLDDVDLSSGWTLLDPDALIKTLGVAAGVHSFTLNGLGVGSTNYAWSSGTTHRAPRWYKPLLNSAGQPITSDDRFVLITEMIYAAPGTQYAGEVVFGVCTDPTSLTSAGMEGHGAHMNMNLSGGPNMGTWTLNSATASNNTGTTYLRNICWGWNQRIGPGSYLTFNGSDEQLNNGSRNPNIARASGQALYLMVGVGTNGSATIVDGSDIKASFKHAILQAA